MTFDYRPDHRRLHRIYYKKNTQKKLLLRTTKTFFWVTLGHANTFSNGVLLDF